jgi:Phytanoyl-CoA dioxygenase (PhyH)
MVTMPTEKDLKHALDIHGFAIIENVLSHQLITELSTALAQLSDTDSARKRGATFAIRNLLELPKIAQLANSAPVQTLVKAVLGDHFIPVRGILFDKIPDANWTVPWHQDVTIAVQEKIEVEGFGPWSVKAGVLHVQPPPSILENMVSVRLHLDPCSEANGALRVIPGSHVHGRIPENEIAAFREGSAECVCAVNQGGALLMRPLLLHASSPSKVPGHRRVIHLDFASSPLPGGLYWFSEATAEVALNSSSPAQNSPSTESMGCSLLHPVP